MTLMKKKSVWWQPSLACARRIFNTKKKFITNYSMTPSNWQANEFSMGHRREREKGRKQRRDGMKAWDIILLSIRSIHITNSNGRSAIFTTSQSDWMCGSMPPKFKKSFIISSSITLKTIKILFASNNDMLHWRLFVCCRVRKTFFHFIWSLNSMYRQFFYSTSFLVC